MNCKFVGYEFKTLEVQLQPGESFYAERGSIVYVENGLQRDVEFNGTGGVIAGIVKSKLSGESMLIVKFYNNSNSPKILVVSGSYCSLAAVKLQNESLICRRGHYVVSTNKVNLTLNMNGQGFLGGLGLFFQKLEGTATVFLDSLGSPIEKILQYGETIEVDENHIVAMQGFGAGQIKAGWSIGNVLRGEGWSLMSVSGPGKLYLSPLPIIPQK